MRLRHQRSTEKCLSVSSIKTHGFSKADKLLQRSEFLELAAKGTKIQNYLFIAYIAKGVMDHNRLGITITKKVGNAVQRNRIKRLIREYFRQYRQSFNVFWDISLIAKRQANMASNKVIFQSLEKLFEKIEHLQTH